LKGVSGDEEIKKFLEFVEDRPYNDLRYSMDSSRLHELGWKPQVSWREGMDQTSLCTPSILIYLTACDSINIMQIIAAVILYKSCKFV